MCGATDIDGYAFCFGLESLERFNNIHAGMLSPARSVVYLIKESIFRPDFSMSRTDRLSLDICPLSELMDMYHTRNATKHHDKVYALLGMSSDDLSNTGLLPDYKISWEDLLKRLVWYLLSEQIAMETWGGDREFIVIKSKGCILGKVVSVEANTGRDKREGVHIMLRSNEEIIYWNIQISAKSVIVGDFVCLLRGASKPTIIRKCYDYFEIIKIGVTLPEEQFSMKDECDYSRDFLLVWDWTHSSGESQHLTRYEELLRTKPTEFKSETEFEDQLERSTRIWNFALILGDAKEYQDAGAKLQEGVK
jgi:hypothetical protein